VNNPIRQVAVLHDLRETNAFLKTNPGLGYLQAVVAGPSIYDVCGSEVAIA